MMIRLDQKNKNCFHYEPPYPVTKNFDDIDVEAPHDIQIEGLMWIPASLVSRFLAQFPFLKSEADELFSIGVTKVCEIVTQERFEGDTIGAVCNVQCTRAMEDYCNGLNSVVKVCTTTRYKNRNRGVSTPSHQTLNHASAPNKFAEDDHTELYVSDAAEVVGVDMAKDLTYRQKRKLLKALKNS